MSYTVEATRRGPCESCEHGIRIGQTIQSPAPGKWEHVSCPTAAPVCPECFTEVARNGACMCGAVGA